MTNTFVVDSNGGISGSLTQLTDGSSYLVAGANVSITSQSNGQVLIASMDTQPSSISGNYGDGSDGAITISIDTTSTRDMYYSSLIVNLGTVLSTNGFRVFVAGQCVISGTIDNSGHNAVGNVSTGATPGGIGSIGGYTTPTSVTGHGGNAPNGAGGPSTTGLLGNNVHGGNGTGGSGGTYNTVGANSGGIKALPTAILCAVLDATSGTPIWNGISGGAGGGANQTATGGGGGGGVIMLAAASIEVASSGVISARGGNGASDLSNGSGGGGGGLLILISQEGIQNNGTIDVNGGTGGSPGGGSGAIGIVIQLTCP